MKNNILIILLTFSSLVFGQNLKGNYSGYWASTNWSYIFDGNGNFEYVTAGHFGFTKSKGKYEIKGDTVYLNAKKTGIGTLDVKRRMLIEKDSCIIDLIMRYDYCKSRNSEFLNSNKRNFKFPQTKPENTKSISDLKAVLDSAFTNPKVVDYFHFEEFPERRLIFKPYFELNELNFPNFKIGNKTLGFKTTDLPKFYIEFIEINQSKESIELEFEIKDEGVEFTMIYEIANKEWKLEYERHNEK
ncbi:hypothetical protein [Robertkochia solimangrovi]|uniref:hypothetical protein n=1 Tax=Robertkochia solimangrovi TaxID=2213046 RepID=UPI00117C3518|nr:hypothetical protein [Robertkochia solimangrovi]TRZ42196.1 hypothetical protein DMZ48_14290 [Robertkochia solimangrovi]